MSLPPSRDCYSNADCLSFPPVTRAGSLERHGYSILELMIALSLLSILLLLGWSLMQSIQDAETRSWKLTQRIRVLRTARAWLADDMDHLFRSAPSITTINASVAPGNPSMIPFNPIRDSLRSPWEKFEGDATGFIATISPSLDPVRFLDRVMNSTDSTDVNPSEFSAGDTLLMTDSELVVEEARESLWPQRGVDVEYRIEPVNRKQGVSIASIQEAQNIQFDLVRREWLLSPSIRTIDTTSSADRQLTSVDLYRGVELGNESYTQPLKETRLYGMVQAQFFYFDGSSWSQEWSSQDRGGAPKAVAFCFDFPPRSDFVRPERSSGNDITDGEFSKDPMENEVLKSFGRNQATVLDPASQENSTNSANDRLVESSDSEAVIIVETGTRMRSLAPSPNPGVFAR